MSSPGSALDDDRRMSPFPRRMTRLFTARGTRVKVSLLVAGGLVAGLFGGAGQARAQYVGQISSIVMDARTGTVLSQSNADLRRFPASLTKLMTLYLTFKALRAGRITLDQVVPVSAHAASMEPSKLGLRPGSYLTVEEAILALVTKSANDAACALGEFLGAGSESTFAQIMTQQAARLSMNDTSFRNASGLPNEEQMTSARDLATLARHIALDFGEYYHYFAVPAFYFRGRYVPNHDPMLKSYPGADGLKTGYTAVAGHNLVTSAVRDNVRLIGVVLGAPSNETRNTVMADLLDDSFRAEGIAPVQRPLVLARNTVAARRRAAFGHGGVVLASSRYRADGPEQVADASIPLSYARLRRGAHPAAVHVVSHTSHAHPAARAHVHLVGMGQAHHVATAHAKTRS